MENFSWIWVFFVCSISLLLALDLFLFSRKSSDISLKEAWIKSGIWVVAALLFNGVVYLERGWNDALNFFTGYLIEKSLSVDNLFVFLLIFNHFKIPSKYVHKVLFWGIFGAIFARAILIFFGIALVNHFSWMFYLLGAFLVFAGFKLLFNKEEEVNPEESRGVKLLKRFMPVSQDGDEDHFFVKRKVSSGRWVYAATPLFVALVVVEITDVIFALDSIPAILAITVDPFIVYTSNFFAILGLRSLYFVLAHVTKLFSYMHYGVALILIFIGIKMIIKDVVEIPVAVALGVIVLLLGATGLYSTRSN